MNFSNLSPQVSNHSSIQLPKWSALSVSSVLLLTHGLNIFILGAWAQKQGTGSGSLSLQLLFMAVRVGTILLGAFLFLRLCRISRFQALVWISMIEVLAHVGLKLLWVWGQMKQDPTAWQGITLQNIFWGLSMSYVFFSPLVVLVAWVGAYLAQSKFLKSSVNLH